MERRISTPKLDKLYRSEVKRHGKSTIDDIISERRSTEKDIKKTKSIFLCHCHRDKTIVEKVIVLFNKIDVNIYVDWMDHAMPSVTNKDTAESIKSKIQHCNRFLFLATYASLKSKWCDWELGVAYSIKSIDHLAIIPIESRSGNWQGSEYLQLYPIMMVNEDNLNQLTTDNVTIVKNQGTEPITLEKWLVS
jgi:hypothetical protein